jgi:hypothetical protein
VDGVFHQLDRVRQTLDPPATGVPVRAMLCFVEADWPLFGGSFRTRGVDVLWPKKAAEVICAGGVLPLEQVIEVHRHLAAAFPPA